MASKVLQGDEDGDTSNHNDWNMTCPLPRTPGPRLGEDMEAYVLLPAARDHMVQCRIVRNKHGMDKGMFPSYYLYLEAEDGVAVRSSPLGVGRPHTGGDRSEKQTPSRRNIVPLGQR